MLLVVVPLLLLVAGAPSYANTLAAAGVQVVAYGALLVHRSADADDLGAARSPDRERAAGTARGRRGSASKGWGGAVLVIIGLTFGVLGTILSSNAKAGTATVLVVLVAGVMAFWGEVHLSRMVLVLGGLAVLGLTMATVVFRGTLPLWPSWMSSAESLSSARHALWKDALTLWCEYPVFGGGRERSSSPLWSPSRTPCSMPPTPRSCRSPPNSA